MWLIDRLSLQCAAKYHIGIGWCLQHHVDCYSVAIPQNIPDSKVHGANMGPNWVLSAPEGPHVGPINLAIRDVDRNNRVINILTTSKHMVTRHGNPDSKVHGANMGPIWGRQDPGGPHVGSTNLAIWEALVARLKKRRPLATILMRTQLWQLQNLNRTCWQMWY